MATLSVAHWAEALDFPTSPTLTALLIDDEAAGLQTLQYMLAEYCLDVEVVGTCQSSTEGLKQYRRLQPDLLFLDIQMPHLNGLEVLEIIGPGTVPAIFVTAFDDYQTQALRLNALDYLVKPVDAEELQNAVARVRDHHRRATVLDQVQSALEYLKSPEITPETRIGLKVGQQIVLVQLLDITHCRSDGNFTNVYLADGERIYCSYSLKTLEEMLPPQWFYRVHREYIVDGRHIRTFDRANGGGLQLTNNASIPISRGAREGFDAFLLGLPNHLF